VFIVAAARPNFMKIAPLYHALTDEPWCRPSIVHTGQHYDANMSGVFFRDLGLPDPHFHLGVGSGSHAQQTGRTMIEFEKLCEEHSPDWIVVVGDVNSTVACALVGAKMHIPVAHLEAGLRSWDRTMPEEINRIVTDSIANLLWTPSPDGNENLAAEGVDESKVVRIGNIMIDSFKLMEKAIRAADKPGQLGLNNKDFCVVTLHRPSNVDCKPDLSNIVNALINAAEHIPIVFPIHPRTRQRLLEFELLERLDENPRITCTEPLSYIEFMSLVVESRLVITDSGGIQEETTYLKIPCLTLRDSTERPITISEGTNRLSDADSLVEHVRRALEQDSQTSRCPELWDGRAAHRAVQSLIGFSSTEVADADDQLAEATG
jgi:UDP-N-acetylglucosamine 2-epimerase (non-hydrolysing)